MYRLVSCIVQVSIMYCIGQYHVMYRLVSCIVQVSIMYCIGQYHVMYKFISCNVQISSTKYVCSMPFLTFRDSIHNFHQLDYLYCIKGNCPSNRDMIRICVQIIIYQTFHLLEAPSTCGGEGLSVMMTQRCSIVVRKTGEITHSVILLKHETIFTMTVLLKYINQA